MTTSYAAINFAEKFDTFDEHWSPKIVAQLNDYHFKLVKIEGEFVWHEHADTDEFFLVISGELTIDTPDGLIVLGEHESVTIPRGVRHRPRAEQETAALLIEPTGVVNTGDAGGPLTRQPGRLS